MLLALLMMVSVVFKGDLSAFAAGDEAIEPLTEAVEADAFAAEDAETAADNPQPADAQAEAEAVTVVPDEEPASTERESRAGTKSGIWESSD